MAFKVISSFPVSTFYPTNHHQPEHPVYLSFVLESKLKWVMGVKTSETEVDLVIEGIEEMTEEREEDLEHAAGKIYILLISTVATS